VNIQTIKTMWQAATATHKAIAIAAAVAIVGGGITHTTAVVTPASNGQWQANGSADLSSFTLIGPIHGNTWHGVSEGSSLFGGMQGTFMLHRS
jgi:hypothetical protein